VNGDGGGTEARAPSRHPRMAKTLASLLILASFVGIPGIGLAATHRIRAAPARWRPAHLYITEGDTVVWANPDSRRHNVVAYGGGWRFRRILDPGESVRRAFDEVRAGGKPYRYRCTLHSAIVDGRCEGMCGLIHVFAA
jgi:plastocyanin